MTNIIKCFMDIQGQPIKQNEFKLLKELSYDLTPH